MTETKLTQKHCVPCRGGVPPLSAGEMIPLIDELHGWEVIQTHHLTKNYSFPDFMTGLRFVNRVGALAEEEGHHPDVYLTWGQVSIQVYTHKIDGLTESDFVLAAKIDELPQT
jgi:4a-hydroxytetrahydrobiopterin dehydratase